MKNSEADIQKQHSLQEQSSRRRWYKIAALLIFLFILWILSYNFFQSDRVKISSDYIIRAEAARDLNKNVDDLTDKDLQSITKFTLVDRTQKGYYIYGLRLSDIKLLKKFSNLRELDLSYVRPVQGNIPVWKKFAAKLHVMTIPKTPLLDLTPLRGLTNLEILDLSHTSVCNLEAIKDLINLCKIQLLYSNVSDLEPLRGLTNLEELSFFGTNISNIEPLKDLKNLHRLDLPCKNVLDFEALGELTGLERLLLEGSNISNLEPLRNLKNLRSLDLNRTKIGNLEPLRGLSKLEILGFCETNISNIEPIKDLKNLRRLYFKDTPVDSLEPLRGLTSLEELQFHFVKDPNLEPLKNLNRLERLSFSITDSIDFEPLKELKNLRQLYFLQPYGTNAQQDINRLKTISLKKAEILDLQHALPELEIDENIYDTSMMFY